MYKLLSSPVLDRGLSITWKSDLYALLQQMKKNYWLLKFISTIGFLEQNCQICGNGLNEEDRVNTYRRFTIHKHTPSYESWPVWRHRRSWFSIPPCHKLAEWSCYGPLAILFLIAKAFKLSVYGVLFLPLTLLPMILPQIHTLEDAKLFLTNLRQSW